MSLSMVVIAAMIAGGLGKRLERYYPNENRFGFEGGIAVVILAIILDRITQGEMAGRKNKTKRERIETKTERNE